MNAVCDASERDCGARMSRDGGWPVSTATARARDCPCSDALLRADLYSDPINARMPAHIEFLNRGASTLVEGLTTGR